MFDRVTFHLPGSWLGPLGSGLMPFYARLQDSLQASGVPVDVIALDRDTALETVAARPGLHLLNHGQFRHPRVLNAGIAYVYPFWNVDPWGIRAFSSIRKRRFDASTIDADIARPFFRKLKKRLVGARTSRYPQPDTRLALPQGATAVFLQSEAHRIVGETCYLTRWEMVETVLATAPGPVIVKPHPRDRDPQTPARLRDLQSRHPALLVSDGNIHDIIDAADRVVTINSAVGIEAYLHRTSVILCGQTDFHHIATTARTRDALTAALQAPMRRRAYDKYIYWYFGLNCLSTSQENLGGRVLDRGAALPDAELP